MKSLLKAVVKCFVMLSVVCLVSSVSFAGAGNESADFLNLGVGARAVAMGGAFTGLANDVSAGYWNPSGLVQLDGSQLITMYDSLPEGMSHVYVGYGKKLAGPGALGLQINYMTSGDIMGVDETGQETVSFNVYSMAIGFTYAGVINEGMSYGINVKNISENIAGTSGAGFGADAGILYKSSDKMKLGLALQNLGTGVTYEGDTEASPLPMVVRAGVSYLAMQDAEKNVVLCADVSKISSDAGVGISAGGEYHVGALAFRLGVLSTTDALVPSFGVGLGGGNILFDIGAGQNPNLGSTFKVSLIGKFGATGQSIAPVRKSSGKASSAKPKAAAPATALEKQLQQAIDQGDFEKADELNKKIEAQKAEKASLEKQIQKAVDDGDFEKADELNGRLEQLKK